MTKLEKIKNLYNVHIVEDVDSIEYELLLRESIILSFDVINPNTIHIVKNRYGNKMSGTLEEVYEYLSTLNIPTKKMDEFLDKVDALCREYDYEIYPTVEGWTGKRNEKGEFETIAIIGENEAYKVVYIDGDGRGK